MPARAQSSVGLHTGHLGDASDLDPAHSGAQLGVRTLCPRMDKFRRWSSRPQTVLLTYAPTLTLRAGVCLLRHACSSRPRALSFILNALTPSGFDTLKVLHKCLLI